MLLEQKLIKTDHYYTLENESMSNNNAVKGDNSNCIWIKKEKHLSIHMEITNEKDKGERMKEKDEEKEEKGWRKRLRNKPKVRKRSLFWCVSGDSNLCLVRFWSFLWSFWNPRAASGFLPVFPRFPEERLRHWSSLLTTNLHTDIISAVFLSLSLRIQG